MQSRRAGVGRPVHTYSIVAYDPESKQFGAAVQSHYFCVGPIVPWVEAGVGAVATQSFVEVSYGPLGLALMRAGKSAEQALQSLLAGDPQADVRQVAMVDARGGVAAHTGSKCIRAAGHKTGVNYSVQANLMHKDTVWGAMGRAYEDAVGEDMAERLVRALEAAEDEGGDIRGKQSAALIVVGGERTGNPWEGKLFDLRVDDHPAPLPELRRLLRTARSYQLADRAEAMLINESMGEARFEQAARDYDAAVALMPDIDANPEPLFWQALALAGAGKVEEALPIFQRVFRLNPLWRELVPRMVESGSVPDDPQLMKRIMGLE